MVLNLHLYVVEAAVRSRTENAEALRRMSEIEQIVKRVDFSWEKGFLQPDEYIEKRRQLESEIAALRPIDYDDLMESADLLKNVSVYWERCNEVGENSSFQKPLSVCSFTIIWLLRLRCMEILESFWIMQLLRQARLLRA